MTLIDGDKIVTAQLYDDEYEEFKEEQMSIIDYVNIYTNGGVTTADDVLGKIRTEIEHMIPCSKEALSMKLGVLDIIDKYREEQ